MGRDIFDLGDLNKFLSTGNSHSIVVGCGWMKQLGSDHKEPPHNMDEHFLIDIDRAAVPDIHGDLSELVNSGRLRQSDGKIGVVMFEFVCKGAVGFDLDTFERWMAAAHKVMRPSGKVRFLSGKREDRQTVENILR